MIKYMKMENGEIVLKLAKGIFVCRYQYQYVDNEGKNNVSMLKNVPCKPVTYMHTHNENRGPLSGLQTLFPNIISV